MRNKIIDFLKGIPIGISNVVPGFSGGTMAVILNIYERFINAFSDFFHQPLKVTKDVWALVLGIIFGILFAIKIITLLLENFPIPTTMYFVGLIIGSIPNILEKTNQKKKSKIKGLDVIIFFACVAAVITLSFLGEKNTNDFDFNFGTVIILFFIAIISSATMVIPGVSGSLILLIIGYYDIVVDLVSSFTNALISLDFILVFSTALPVIPFFIGLVIGIVLISKLIKLLLRKYPQTVYYAILGLLFASPFAIIKDMSTVYSLQIAATSWLIWGIGLLTMVIGAFSVNYLSKFDKGETNEKTI